MIFSGLSGLPCQFGLLPYCLAVGVYMLNMFNRSSYVFGIEVDAPDIQHASMMTGVIGRYFKFYRFVSVRHIGNSKAFRYGN